MWTLLDVTRSLLISSRSLEVYCCVILLCVLSRVRYNSLHIKHLLCGRTMSLHVTKHRWCAMSIVLSRKGLIVSTVSVGIVRLMNVSSVGYASSYLVLVLA